MAYATQTDLERKFGEDEIIALTDRSDAGVVDVTVLAEAQVSADAEINGYLRGRYTLPLASTPDLIKRIALDVSRWHLYSDRTTDEVQKRYETCLSLLRQISRGEITLDADEPAGGSIGAPDIPAVDQPWSRANRSL